MESTNSSNKKRENELRSLTSFGKFLEANKTLFQKEVGKIIEGARDTSRIFNEFSNYSGVEVLSQTLPIVQQETLEFMETISFDQNAQANFLQKIKDRNYEAWIDLALFLGINDLFNEKGQIQHEVLDQMNVEAKDNKEILERIKIGLLSSYLNQIVPKTKSIKLDSRTHDTMFFDWLFSAPLNKKAKEIPGALQKGEMTIPAMRAELIVKLKNAIQNENISPELKQIIIFETNENYLELKKILSDQTTHAAIRANLAAILGEIEILRKTSKNKFDDINEILLLVKDLITNFTKKTENNYHTLIDKISENKPLERLVSPIRNLYLALKNNLGKNKNPPKLSKRAKSFTLKTFQKSAALFDQRKFQTRALLSLVHEQGYRIPGSIKVGTSNNQFFLDIRRNPKRYKIEGVPFFNAEEYQGKTETDNVFPESDLNKFEIAFKKFLKNQYPDESIETRDLIYQSLMKHFNQQLWKEFRDIMIESSCGWFIDSTKNKGDTAQLRMEEEINITYDKGKLFITTTLDKIKYMEFLHDEHNNATKTEIAIPGTVTSTFEMNINLEKETPDNNSKDSQQGFRFGEVYPSTLFLSILCKKEHVNVKKLAEIKGINAEVSSFSKDEFKQKIDEITTSMAPETQRIEDELKQQEEQNELINREREIKRKLDQIRTACSTYKKAMEELVVKELVLLQKKDPFIPAMFSLTTLTSSQEGVDLDKFASYVIHHNAFDSGVKIQESCKDYCNKYQAVDSLLKDLKEDTPPATRLENFSRNFEKNFDLFDKDPNEPTKRFVRVILSIVTLGILAPYFVWLSKKEQRAKEQMPHRKIAHLLKLPGNQKTKKKSDEGEKEIIKDSKKEISPPKNN